jgi:fatty acyl-CoA reductase
MSHEDYYLLFGLFANFFSVRYFPDSRRLTQVYTKVNRAVVALQYFTTNEWTFVNKNQLSLSGSFSSDDVDRFYTDARRIHWPTYIETYILGVRKFLLKEDPSTLPLARAKLQR